MLSKIKKYIKYNTGILILLDDIVENVSWDLMKKSEIKAYYNQNTWNKVFVRFKLSEN
jgi:hypothetical protein|tara:strand:+ start:654 stop:827 length:174 start_codon:yes stop_codon:yes gene_type:complete